MAARRKKAEEPKAELCEEHFPDGWEGIDKQHEGVKVTAVGCEHGTFNRADTESPKDPNANGGDGGDGDGQGDGSGGDGGQGDGSGEGDGE